MSQVESGRIIQVSLSNGGVPKKPVLQALVTSLGLAGDHQDSIAVHGGPERAVCLYSLERIQALQAEGHPITPGDAGENLTLSGLDWEQMAPGTRLRLGSQVVIEITRYTTPCNTIAGAFSGGDYGRISQTRHPGWSRLYGRVLQTGYVFSGDAVEILAQDS